MWPAVAIWWPRSSAWRRSSALLLNGPLLLRGISELLRDNLGQVQIRADEVDYQVQSWRRTGLIVLYTLGPWLVSVCLAACVIQWIQVGWLWVPQKLTPDLQRIAPARNLLRLIEPAQLMRMLFLVFKLVGVLLLAGWLLWKNLPSIATLVTSTQRTCSASRDRS